MTPCCSSMRASRDSLQDFKACLHASGVASSRQAHDLLCVRRLLPWPADLTDLLQNGVEMMTHISHGGLHTVRHFGGLLRGPPSQVQPGRLASGHGLKMLHLWTARIPTHGGATIARHVVQRASRGLRGVEPVRRAVHFTLGSGISDPLNFRLLPTLVLHDAQPLLERSHPLDAVPLKLLVPRCSVQCKRATGTGAQGLQFDPVHPGTERTSGALARCHRGEALASRSKRTHNTGTAPTRTADQKQWGISTLLLHAWRKTTVDSFLPLV